MDEKQATEYRKAFVAEALDLLKTIPPMMVDAKMQAQILTWDDPPKALQVLEVLDKCISGALAADMVVQLLQGVYNDLLISEGITHEDLLPKAIWRKEALA